MDEDGLCLCDQCQDRLTTTPTTRDHEDDLDDRLKALIGKSAGAICHTLNLPFVPPYRAMIEAASRIAYDEDRHMSAWSFITQWLDGTTVWQAADKRATAVVDAEGNVRVEGYVNR